MNGSLIAPRHVYIHLSLIWYATLNIKEITIPTTPTVTQHLDNAYKLSGGQRQGIRIVGWVTSLAGGQP